MDPVEVDILFLEHIVTCIRMQKVINGSSSGHIEEQDIIDNTVLQIEEMVKEYRNRNNRSLAQKSRVMYEEHAAKVTKELGRFTGPGSEKGTY